MKRIKSIHFVGIKGVGNTPLAIIAKEAGIKVTGSDVNEEFITDEPLRRAGIEVQKGFSEEHVGDAELVIATGAHGGFDNPEVIAAKAKGVQILMQGEAVGKFMDGSVLSRPYEGISVAGSHGKTTTTAMVATMLKANGMDPSYVIGTSNVPSLGLPGHFGRGKYFVAEADEYATEPQYDKTPKFLWQHPKIAVLTNIELDHPDLYPTLEAITKAFLDFIRGAAENGVVIINGDDPQLRQIVQGISQKVIRFGQSPNNDYILKRVSISGERTFFWVEAKGATLGEFSIRVVGEHNGLNALAALIVGLETGLSLGQIRDGLKEYSGSKRRFEYIGKLSDGGLVFDDYAHHPTEIRKTLKAARQSFPKHKIITIFQPHTYSRTKKLFEQFKSSFSDSDTIILTDLYPSLREEPDPSVNSKLLADATKLVHKEVVFLPTLGNVIEYVTQKSYDSNTIVITMGAGDVYKVGYELTSKKGY